MPKACAHVTISGKVQGVYYRLETRDQAIALRVKGWVKNLPDGRVEGFFEGDREKVEALVAWCRQGPPRAAVSEVKVKWEECRGDFDDFKVAR